MIADSFWRLGALFGSLVPGVVIAAMLFRLGERRLSPRLLVVAIASGAMIAILPLTLTIFEPILSTKLDTTLWLFVRAFGFAGLSEEGAKLLACLFIVAPYYQRRGRMNLILACAGVGLGFALIENVSYVLRAPDEWKSVAIGRALSAVPGHALLGLVMGHGLASAELAAQTTLRVFKVALTWLVCATLHGLYDLPLFIGELLPLSLPFVLKIGSYLSAATPTLLSAAILFATALNAVLALRAIAACRRDLAAHANGRVYRLSPKMIERVVFAKATGLLLGGLLALLAIVPVVIGVFATAFGAAPTIALSAGSVCIILGTLSWGVGGQEFLALPADIDRWKRAFLNFSHRRTIAATTLAAVSVSAVFGLLYWSYVGLRHSIAIALVASGASLADGGSIDRAISNFNAALTVQSDLLVAYIARADAYRTLQNYDRALADLDHATSIHPNDGTAHAALAQIYSAKHDYVRALPEFNRAVELDPENPAIYIARGSALNSTGDTSGASRDADRALELKPNMAEAHALRGQIYTSRDEVSQAISEYGEAIGIDPKNSGAYFARGRLYFETQNFGAAAEDFVKAAAKGDRSFVILWLFLARGHLGQDGNRELAIWSETTPKNAWPFPLAELYLGSRPLAQVEQAATTNDQKCELAFYLGQLHIVTKNEKEAVQPLTRAKNLCPDDYVETRLARKDSQRLQAALDGATAGTASLQGSKSNVAGGRARAGVSPSANVQPDSTPSPPTTKAIWRTMLTNGSSGIDRALRVEGISIDDGSVAIVSLARPRNRSLQTEYVMTLTTRNLSKKTASNYLSARVAVVGDHSSETVAISLPLGTAGFFQGGLSRAAVEQFIGAAYHGRILKLTFFGVDAMNARIPLGKTAVEIDDDARAALELGAHGLTDTAITASEKKSSDLAAKEPQLSKSVTRDDNVRRYLSMIEAEAAQSQISVALLSAKRSPDGADLIVTAQVKNRWNQAVMLGELSVEAFRLLNPNLSKVTPTYPESLISARALNVAAEPIAAGETKTLTIRIGDLKSLRSFLESQGPSRQRHATLTFYGPSGQRNVARIAGITKLFQ